LALAVLFACATAYDSYAWPWVSPQQLQKNGQHDAVEILRKTSVENSVFVIKTQAEYPTFPYDDGSNPVYRSLRSLFEAWGRNPGNPFGDLVEPKGVVVIKPNWVKHYNPRGSLECLITHPSLVKYVIDFAAKALGERGRIVVGDAPIQSCDFQKLVELSRIQEVLDLARRKYPHIVFELEDWRLTIMRNDILGSGPANASAPFLFRPSISRTTG